jgi:hypothetical protein
MLPADMKGDFIHDCGLTACVVTHHPIYFDLPVMLREFLYFSLPGCVKVWSVNVGYAFFRINFGYQKHSK